MARETDAHLFRDEVAAARDNAYAQPAAVVTIVLGVTDPSGAMRPPGTPALQEPAPSDG